MEALPGSKLEAATHGIAPLEARHDVKPRYSPTRRRAGWRISASGSAYQLERTQDGGVTWQGVGERVDWQEGFQFVDANTGWLVSGDDFQRTMDGGKTWEEIKPLVE
jgi:photosystem II stability/assembly factor-like uncharacterized protein